MNHIDYIYNGVGLATMASQLELKTKKYDFLCLSYILITYATLRYKWVDTNYLNYSGIWRMMTLTVTIHVWRMWCDWLCVLSIFSVDCLRMSYVGASGCTLVPPTHPLAILRLKRARWQQKVKANGVSQDKRGLSEDRSCRRSCLKRREAGGEVWAP